jgi:hypothetical protein
MSLTYEYFTIIEGQDGLGAEAAVRVTERELFIKLQSFLQYNISCCTLRLTCLGTEFVKRQRTVSNLFANFIRGVERFRSSGD